MLSETKNPCISLQLFFSRLFYHFFFFAILFCLFSWIIYCMKFLCQIFERNINRRNYYYYEYLRVNKKIHDHLYGSPIHLLFHMHRIITIIWEHKSENIKKNEIIMNIIFKKETKTFQKPWKNSKSEFFCLVCERANFFLIS